MLALIDADIVLHRVGYTTDGRVEKDGTIKLPDPEWIARARCNEMLEGILADTGATEYQLWLSDSRDNNFRTHLWAGYKANRTQPRPSHYDFIKEFLITEWEARIAYGMEADDALGINQIYVNPDTLSNDGRSCICSIDKDLMQIPGLHYNFVKKEWIGVTPKEGLLSFYVSILVGDTTDNIKGCRGIGPVKATRAFANANANSEDEYLDGIFKLYQEQEKEKSTEEILQHILLAGRLLKIRQSEQEKVWHFPRCELIQEIFA